MFDNGRWILGHVIEKAVTKQDLSRTKKGNLLSHNTRLRAYRKDQINRILLNALQLTKERQ